MAIFVGLLREGPLNLGLGIGEDSSVTGSEISTELRVSRSLCPCNIISSTLMDLIMYAYYKLSLMKTRLQHLHAGL
jgi:hypothetical protein